MGSFVPGIIFIDFPDVYLRSLVGAHSSWIMIYSDGDFPKLGLASLDNSYIFWDMKPPLVDDEFGDTLLTFIYWGIS